MKTKDKFLQDIMSAVSPTIIVYDESWGRDLPDWIRTQIQIKRFEEGLKQTDEGIKEASNEEILAYLYTCSLVAPMTEEWTRIYQSIFQNVVGNKIGEKNLPADFQEEIELSEQEENELRNLKVWIFKKRTKREIERFKDATKEQKD